MKKLSIDIEGAYGIMHPSKPGFYTSCVGLVMHDDETDEYDEKLIWLEHAHALMTPGAIDIIQMEVDKCDIMIGHNLKYDCQALMHYGVNFRITTLWDTLIAEWMLSGQDKQNRTNFKLDTVATDRGIEGKHGDKVRTLWDGGMDTRDIPEDILGKYQLQDCRVPLELYSLQKQDAVDEGMLKVIELHMEWTQVLLEMEYNGINFDDHLAQTIHDEYREKASEIEEYFRLLCGVPDLSLGSNQQKSAFIHGGTVKISREVWEIKEFKHHSTYKPYQRRVDVQLKGLGFPRPTNPKSLRGLPKGTKPKKTEIDYWLQQGAYWTTDAAGIDNLSARTNKLKDLKDKLLAHAKYTKVYETLVGAKNGAGLMAKQAPDGKMYPKLNQCVAVTGRLSSSDPNGQNLFKIIKTCFKPKHDFIGQHDLSQIEWRTAAEVSQDRVMMGEVNSGIDQHAATVKELMEMKFLHKGDEESDHNRKNAKIFNFRMIFGGSKWGFFLDHKMPNFLANKWQDIINAFWNKYYGLRAYHDNNIRLVWEGTVPQAITGRKFVFNKTKWVDGQFIEDANQIMNYYIQGPCADFIALMAVVIRRGMMKAGMKSQMILTVHDSLVFDIVASEADALKDLCYTVSNNLHGYIAAYFGIDWNTRLEGEFEIGTDYGSLNFVAHNQSCKEVL